MKWFWNITGNKIKLYERNELAAYERTIYEMVSARHYPNVPFLSLALQLRHWVSIQSVASIGGLPPWWNRRQSGHEIVATQTRLVGGEWSIPKSLGERTIEFSLSGGDSDSGRLSFRVEESVQQVIFHLPRFTGAGFPSADDVSLLDPTLENERPYWLNQRASFQDLSALSDVVLSLLDGASMGPTDPIVLPAPGLTGSSRIEGVQLAGAYRRLLAFANGIRVNELSIWGLDSGMNRIFTAQNERYFYVGDDADGLLALKLDGAAVADELFRVHAPSGEINGLGINVIELALRSV